jgi:hypothetical protein
MPEDRGAPIERLRALLREAVESRPDADAIADAAGMVFTSLRRTDMRSGIANMVRRLAQLHAAEAQPISAEGWQALSEASALLQRPGITPADVRAFDERLGALGLDVDLQPTSAHHRPGPQHSN